MSLLIPDTGLLFWMALCFGIVVFILGKYGFPVIIKAIDKRTKSIAESLEAARQADERLLDIESQAKLVMEKAYAERSKLLDDARQMGEGIIEQARQTAEKQVQDRLAAARTEAEEFRRRAMAEVMGQIAGISIKIAGKVVGHELNGEGQQAQLIDRLLLEETNSKPQVNS